MKDLLHEPVWIRIINNLLDKPNYSSRISKEIDVTYSYVHKICNELIKTGLIKENKIGRTRLFTLTDKGKELAIGIKKGFTD